MPPQLPWLAVMDTSSSPEGSESTTWTPVAPPGPLFVTAIANDTWPFTAMAVGLAALIRERSGPGPQAAVVAVAVAVEAVAVAVAAAVEVVEVEVVAEAEAEEVVAVEVVAEEVAAVESPSSLRIVAVARALR